nr:HNH endonuclease [Peribacillus sp. SI8-4]
MKDINNLKKKYLSTMLNQNKISENTAKYYANHFSKISEYERDVDKELMYFNLEEIETILHSYKSSSKNTIEHYARSISGYLNWGVKEGIIKKNPIADFKPDDFIKYVTNNELYFTDKDLERYEDYCTNYQDSVILRLLFIGVGGKQMSEIRNLKKEDVNFQKKQLRLINSLREDKNGNPLSSIDRYIDVSDRTLEIINGAIDEKVYGEELIENIIHSTELVDNEFIIKALKTDKVNADNAVNKPYISGRITKIAKICGLKKLDEKLIKHSGMLYTAYKDMIDDEVSSVDLKIIADKFNINSYHDLKGFITSKNIMETYNNFTLDENNVDDTDGDIGFPEGKKQLKRHIERERNPKVIKLAKQYYKEKYGKVFCEICSFDFYKKYGEIGENFIEGHHTIPVSELEEGQITRVEDIALVCSNCHRMLHRRRPWLTIQQLRELLK